MKKYCPLIMLVMVLGTINANAGDGFKRVYFGVSVTPGVSFRYLKANVISASSGSTFVNDITNRNNYEKPEFGFRAGVKVGVNIFRWMGIESGVDLAGYSYTSKNVPTTLKDYNGQFLDSIKLTTVHRYYYMGIPLNLKFTFGKKVVRGIIVGGTSFDFLLRYNEIYTQTYSNGQTHKFNSANNYLNFKTFNLSPFFGIGMDIYCTNAFVIRIMPVAQMQALKNDNQPVAERLWNVGCNVSFMIGFINK